MNRSIAPKIFDYTSLQLPALDSNQIITASGETVELSVLNRGYEPVARVTIMWSCGSLAATTQEAAMVMAKALREGTKTFSGSEIEELLDYNGAWLNIECDKENLIITLYTLSRNLDALLPLLKDLITNPAFPPDRVNHVKVSQADALKLKEHKVDFMAGREFSKQMAGTGNPYSIMTSPEGFLRVTREEVLQAHETIVKGSTPSFWLCGNISPDMVKNLSSMISQLCFHTRTSASREKIVPADPQTGTVAEILMPDSKQAAVMMGFQVPRPVHPDFQMIRLCSICLGGYFGSRLNVNIREEKGLTYGIHSTVSNLRCGSFLKISAQTSADNVAIVIEETKKEIERLKTCPPQQQELDIIRRYVMSMMASTLDSPFSIMDFYLGVQMQGTDASVFDERQNLLKRLTPEMFAECAAKYFDCDKLTVVIAK